MSLTLSIISFILSVIAIIYFNKYFISKKIIDKINIRSSHKTIATRSGGISVFLVVFLISTYNYLFGVTIFDYSFLIPISILALLGSYDDIYNVDFKLKFIFQIITAKIIVDNGLIIDNFHGFMNIYELNRLLAQLFTIFIIVAIINAINFIDGIDGLALSIVMMFLSLFEVMSINKTPFINLTTMIIFGLLPLYYFNFRIKQKVFLGDSGSMFLGGVVSIYVIHILSNNYLIKDQFDINKIMFVISILFYPIIDIVRVFTIRLYKRKSPFEADKNHIHHLIEKKVKNHLITSVSILSASIIIFIIIHIVF